ncbi:helix-turn-helix domain-containing protein [Agaribacter marinus]|uniref:Helix-turn-helix transcriptional regulator n=1 Tax=Virgibacillus salarius TaxID=447199 RepID=A0A941DWC4_9BACI|nr:MULTISPECIES: helix-turn-helix domain-containing protein [Bacillaceae]MBR7796661.1 helix-turn-helix transcriptional regulator [Virgibacillus salarius]NAZ09371.1 helix-turn-helix domain-containing protein [Agaribacter marinus]WBX81409.1 helix-turn-helix domain-containing protein [Virgibacillus salarius]
MLGKNIKRIRKKKGISLTECAQRANISKSYLSSMERNVNHNPSIQILEKIATVLDVDLRTILGLDDKDAKLPEHEWIDFVNELKRTGIDKGQLHEYRAVIEFAKWQKEKDDLG